ELEKEHPANALHLARVALALDPQYAPARRVVEDALAILPDEQRRRENPPAPCPSPSPEASPASAAEAVSHRDCLEARSGLLSGLGPVQSEPLIALARLDLEAGRPESAVIMLSLAE